MASQPAWQTNVIHTLPNISRSAVNQTMKFGLLINYNMRNIFLWKSYTKCGAEISPEPFYEKWKLSRSRDQLAKISIYFYCIPYWGLSKYIKVGYMPLAFTSYEAFQKPKRGLGLVSLPYILHNFWRKMFLLVCSINWPTFILLSNCLYFARYCAICVL